MNRFLAFIFKNTRYWNSHFDHFCRWASRISGKPIAFNLALAAIIFWMLSGPVFGFSDTWQLIINTATTILTFLMVFLIQHTQNRDNEAVHVKLNELIRALDGAKNELLDLEELEEKELDLLRARYQTLARSARSQASQRSKDTEK